MNYEYGIAWRGDVDDPHRTGMTAEEAVEWLCECLDDGGKPGVFQVIRRTLGPWEQTEPRP